MPDVNWHEPTADEIAGAGDYAFVVDISPGVIPHQAAQDGDALLLVGKPGWIWSIKEYRQNGKKRTFHLHMGETDTKEAAIGQVQERLGKLRSA